ncbi:MAG: hypothetical protein UT32_C0016G0003 [Parcubacteria group bacterium GW2011_GWC2_39_14]|nr:MAG: hypothetical protein UT32_C0016G0003 [Parcubacteria group bacterium GW2011_GWC2_39_14]KKR55133.1 MAG: hypothetical protein UT91_C0004G0032 [Parcubacteria group bacterium GW2011_GWA2_40_23]
MYVENLSCANYSKKITPDQSDWPGERKLLGGEVLLEVLDSASHEVGLVQVRTDVRSGNLDTLGPVERDDHAQAITNRTHVETDSIEALQGLTNRCAHLGTKELSGQGGNGIFGNGRLEVRDDMSDEGLGIAVIEVRFEHALTTDLMRRYDHQEPRMNLADLETRRFGIALGQAITNRVRDLIAGHFLSHWNPPQRFGARTMLHSEAKFIIMICYVLSNRVTNRTF